GPAAATEGQLQPRPLSRPGARRASRAQALRVDRRRQRLAVVHHRRARPSLGRRRPRPAQGRAPLGVRGRLPRAHPPPLKTAPISDAAKLAAAPSASLALLVLARGAL